MFCLVSVLAADSISRVEIAAIPDIILNRWLSSAKCFLALDTSLGVLGVIPVIKIIRLTQKWRIYLLGSSCRVVVDLRINSHTQYSTAHIIKKSHLECRFASLS